MSQNNGGSTADIESGDASADAALIARICWYYFKEGQTQDAIAQRLKITRKRVNRILGDARENGFVQITITDPVGVCVALEAGLVERFGLRRAIVVPAPMAETDVRVFLGAAAGRYVSEALPPAGSLGITWGGTINAAAQNVKRRARDGSRVVLLCGGLAQGTHVNPFDNAAMMARALDATCYYVTAPMFAETPALRDALVASEPVRSVLAMVPKLDLALLSAIDLSEQSKALEYGVISRETCRSLLDAGAVGDICGHYLNADGQVIEHPLTARVVNPALKDLLAIKERVLAAGGLQKTAIIRAAIRAGLCDVLITDESAARELIA
ncbi:sugar-binding transcriptional regulator [Pseudorhodoplanes sinuspersici]|uniref:Transcriptional regulator n=1 Tax=Pseudorhodoplanes sinuspersici TaxID=1235591 RepID=A0A1W6ZQH7_9HYPH|nr:sugar-binding transcriptional regulator [Pseudorhodoplanes sinuspersici]ARP99653.1 transcriptional regulator [Pseudorhodoplanes sinuspersici]RKE70631.1 DNA-binding transcriptional regulator LsrR (DeoR family) [Pseudorhodoplanes sinuspersici]